MRFRLISILIASALFLLVPLAEPQGSKGHSDCCTVVAEALSAFQQVKKGMTRADVEKLLSLDGGMDFRTKSRYVFPKCDYLKLDLEFSPDPKVTNASSPRDTVISIGRPYLAYPSKD